MSFGVTLLRGAAYWLLRNIFCLIIQSYLQLLNWLKSSVTTISCDELCRCLLVVGDHWLRRVALHLAARKVKLFNVHRILVQVGQIITWNMDTSSCTALRGLCLLATWAWLLLLRAWRSLHFVVDNKTLRSPVVRAALVRIVLLSWSRLEIGLWGHALSILWKPHVLCYVELWLWELLMSSMTLTPHNYSANFVSLAANIERLHFFRVKLLISLSYFWKQTV